MSELLYGSGLRLMECVRLRVEDIDFGYGHITIRDGKGLRERVTLLPERLRRPLQLQLERVKELHLRDVAKVAVGFTCLSLCDANIRTLLDRGRGNMFSLRRRLQPILDQMRSVVITPVRKIFRMP